MARKYWIGLAVVVIGVSVWRFGPDTYTLEPGYTDHLKHAYDSWAFLQEGFNIFSEPVVEWNVTARHPHLLWEYWPHLYPIGAVFLFLPFGVLANLGWLPDLAVHWLMVALLGVGATWAIHRFTRYGAVVAVFVATAFVHWGLNGFYDPIVAGLAVWAVDRYRRDDTPTAVVLFTVALSLHYRLWYLAPLAVAAAWKLYRRHGWNWRLTAAVVVGGISLATFTTTRSAYLTLSGGEGASLADRLGSWTPYALVGFVVVAGIVWWFDRSVLAATLVLLAGVVAFTAAQFADWYPILFTPLFAVVTDSRSRNVLFVGWLHLGFPNLLDLGDLFVRGIT